MLRALCEDLARLLDAEVTATLDSRCQIDMPPGINLIPVSSPVHGHQEFSHQAAIADATFVIAPELDNILTQRVRALREAGVDVIAPTDNWLDLLSCKRILTLHGVPMIPTFPLEQDEPHVFSSDYAVIKPSFGAGSQTISVVPVSDVEKLRTPPKTHPLEELIVQPYIPGTAVSVGVICNSLGERTVLPVAQQMLSDDGYLRYEGGVIPWRGEAVKQVYALVRRCLDQIDGLQGYIGFDFVVPDASPEEPLLVEINPRLCTSYIGYRQLTDDNLAALMLPNWPKQSISWKKQQVVFQPDGTLELSPIAEEQPCE